MASKRTYEFDIIARIDSAIKSVDNLTSSTQKRLDALNFKAGVSALKDGFDLVKGAANAAFGAIENFTSKAVEEALQAEAANQKLANSLRLSGDFTTQAADNFDKLAKQIQNTTTFTADSVKESIALAKQYKLTNSEAEKTIKVAADLAAVQGISLDEATRKVAQTFNGFVDKSLAKTIPALKNLKQESLVAGDALGIIGARVKGSAEALADNFTGAVFHAQEGLNDIFETFGGFITQNPAIIAGIKEIAKGFTEFNTELEKNGDSIKSLITDGFLLMIQVAPKFVQVMERIFNNLAFGKLIIDKLGASLGALAAALVNPFQASDIFDQLGQDIDDLDSKFGETINSSEAFFGTIEKQTQKIVDNVTKAAKAAKDSSKEIKNIGPSTSGAEERKKDLFNPDDFKKKVEGAAKEPLKFTLDAIVKGEKISAKEGVAIGTGLVANVLKGADGAKKLLQEGLGAAADLLLPGIGGAVSEIVGILSQGPEKVKSMVEEFTNALPDLIAAIIEAIPALIGALVDAVPKIIDKLVEKTPEIVEALAREMPTVAVKLATLMPTVAVQLITSIVQNIPEIVSGFVKGLIDGAKQFIDKLIEEITGAFGDIGNGLTGSGESDSIFAGIPVLQGIGDIFGFASGGRIPDVPRNRGDGFGPVMLDGGEQVLNRDLSNRIEQALVGPGPTQTATFNFQMGLETFASISVECDRRGFRLRSS